LETYDDLAELVKELNAGSADGFRGPEEEDMRKLFRILLGE